MALIAEGGNARSYRWSVSDSDGGAVTVEGSTLSLTSPAAGSVTFTVAVSDDHCASAPVNVTVPVDASGGDTCPRIEPDVLPAPCRGSPYTQTFEVRGGVQQYELRALSLPDGLSFDAKNRTLQGIYSGSGALVLEVTDDAGHHTAKTYSLTPRDTCWFAYASTGASSPGLQFYDPVLKSYRSFPQSQGVVEFSFSPDGRYLVYRTSVSGHSALRLVAAPEWRTHAIAFDGDVDQYSWSPDSSRLAVAFHSGASGYLGVAEVSGSVAASRDGGAEGRAETGASGADAGGVDLHYLGPVAADVGAQLTWSDDRTVLFLAPNEGGDGDFTATRITAGTLPPPARITDVPVSTGTLLRRAGSGMFVLDPAGPGDLAFLGGLIADTFFEDFGVKVPDPAGRFAAMASAGQLEVFSAALFGAQAPIATSSGCDSLLAWSPVAELVACANDAATNNRVALFDVGTGSATPPFSPISGTPLYDVGASANHRRGFSLHGNWFAFASADWLYVANWTGSTPRVVCQDVPLGQTPRDHADDLAFSPDGTQLLWHVGDTLLWRPLDNVAGGLIPIETAMPAAHQCTDELLSDPEHWCGSAATSPTLAWSTDSRFAAFQAASGAIKLRDFSPKGELKPVCTDGCSRAFAFQP